LVALLDLLETLETSLLSGRVRKNVNVNFQICT
jgi:hypothetical protein